MSEKKCVKSIQSVMGIMWDTPHSQFYEMLVFLKKDNLKITFKIYSDTGKSIDTEGRSVAAWSWEWDQDLL